MPKSKYHVRADDLDWADISHGKSYEFRCRRLGVAAGGEKLGCTLYEVPPGKRSWPYHFHNANEEAIYVLEGRGTLRLDGDEEPVEAGDYVALPARSEGGHQVVNSSDAPLRFLCFSTMIEPDVNVYPESGKLGVFTGTAPGRKEGRRMTLFLPDQSEVGYWDGED